MLTTLLLPDSDPPASATVVFASTFAGFVASMGVIGVPSYSGASGVIQEIPGFKANPFAIGNLSRGSPFVFRPPNLNGTTPP